jgi:group I intron endonuclease
METKIIGIYKITNLVNNKVYIGQSWDVLARFKSHRKKSTSVHLKSSIEKYGLDNFKFEILREFSKSGLTQLFLNVFEIKYISDFKSYDPKFGYNKTFGGEGGLPTEETKQKIGIKLKGRYFSSESRQRMSIARKGKTHLVSKETGYAISIARIGHSVLQETRDKISKSLTNRKFGPRNPSAGKNISKSLTGKYIGRVWINNGIFQTRIDKDQLLNYLQVGFQLGRIKKNEHRVYIHKENNIKRVPNHLLESYLKNGYEKGTGTAQKWVTINNGVNVLRVKEEELSFYPDWKLGTLSNKEITNTKEYKDKMSRANKGRKYVHKGSIIKFVKPSEYEKYLNDGWTDGKKIK